MWKEKDEAKGKKELGRSSKIETLRDKRVNQAQYFFIERNELFDYTKTEVEFHYMDLLLLLT